MTARNFAFYGGIILLAMGIISFIPGLEGDTSTLPVLNLNTSYGLFMGLFPMNIVNKLVVSIVGISGIMVSRKVDLNASITFSKVVFFAMGILAILGLSETTNSLGGYYPLFGGVILVNTLFALCGGYFGFLAHKTHVPTHHNTHTHA